MKTWHETLAGVAAIVALVAVAVWYADESEGQPWFNTKLAATGTTQAALPQVCVNFVDWSADGKKLLTLSRGETSALGVLTLHDATGNVCRMPIDVSGDHVHCAALAPDGRHVLAGTAGGHLWWIDLDSVEMVQLVKLPESTAFTRLAIATSGRVVAAATNLGSIFVCHPPDQDAVLLASDRQSSVADVRFSWDDKQLLSARNDGSIAVWDLVSGSLRQELARHDRGATAAAFLRDDQRIVSAGRDDTVRVWNIASGKELWRGEFGLHGVNTVDVSQDGTTAAWAGFCGKIVVWDLARERKKFEIATPAKVIYHLKLSSDGTTLAVAGMEGTVRLYDVQSGTEQEGIEIAPGMNAQSG